MKKIGILLLTVVFALFLSGCSHTLYPVDGEFLAYEVSISSNAPTVTYVSVTVKDNEIVKYTIDVRQGSYI